MNRSPVSSTFGYYVGGQTGNTFSVGVLGVLLKARTSVGDDVTAVQLLPTRGDPGGLCRVGGAGICAACLSRARSSPAQSASEAGASFNDSHFHLTNYIQEGIDVREFLRDHGEPGRALDAVRHSAAAAVVARATPATSRRPTTCRRDAPLYYYSFTDAYIARPTAR